MRLIILTTPRVALLLGDKRVFEYHRDAVIARSPWVNDEAHGACSQYDVPRGAGRVWRAAERTAGLFAHTVQSSCGSGMASSLP